MSGSGYGAFEKIHVAFLDSSNGLSILGVTMTDGSGRFSVEVAIPSNASVGAQKVVALGTVSKLRVVQVFLVT